MHKTSGFKKGSLSPVPREFTKPTLNSFLCSTNGRSVHSLQTGQESTNTPVSMSNNVVQ